MTKQILIPRRTFLAGTATLFGSLSKRAAFAQPSPPALNRQAIVIGIDNYLHLPGLRAAVSGAREMAEFLEREGFSVHLFTDEGGEVRAFEIGDMIESLIDQGTMDQLVIYFSGHGTLSGTSEYWLMSRAPRRGDEAISVDLNAELARRSGVPNVVFISDACRSAPESLQMSSAMGQQVFPSPLSSLRRTGDVDLFYAALPGQAALELPLSESVAGHEGIFTKVFLSAFEEPDANMILELSEGLYVVPNRRLEDYLHREVSLRAQQFSIKLNQNPDARVTSGDTVYIGRSLKTPEAGSAQTGTNRPVNTISGEIQSFVQETDTGLWAMTVFESTESESRVEARARVFETIERQTRDVVLPLSGVAVYGTSIRSIEGPDIRSIEAMDTDDGSEAWLVDIGDSTAASALVTFRDGSGGVIAIFRGFGTHLTVDHTGIINLRLNPTESNPRFSEYLATLDVSNGYSEVALLRGLATQAGNDGVFRFDSGTDYGRQSAGQFAIAAPNFAALDPAVALQFAYASNAAYLDDETRSIHESLRETLGMSLFDSAMLSEVLIAECRDGNGIVPPAPMMRKGWEFLPAAQIALADVFNRARPHLKHSLWSSFGPEGVALLREDMEEALETIAPCRVQSGRRGEQP